MPVGVKTFTTPVGNTAPALSGANTKFSATFVARAEFNGAPIANGEYRQYVKGQFKAGGSLINHHLCPGDLLSNQVFKEDGCPATHTAYGHRAYSTVWDNLYAPTATTGPNYSMSDSPGFTNLQPATNYSVELYFKGELIDVSAPSAQPLSSKAWTVIGQATTPTRSLTDTTTVPPAGGLQPGDRIYGAHLSKNLDDGSSEVHLVIIRPTGAPALDAAKVPVELKDGAGQRVRIAGSVAHEIVGHGRSTATLVFTLKQNGQTPVELEIQGDLTLRLAISLHG